MMDITQMKQKARFWITVQIIALIILLFSAMGIIGMGMYKVKEVGLKIMIERIWEGSDKKEIK